jgi:hypothetical protein
MDCRLTIGETETFLDMLTVCMEEKKKADMILDVDGLTRASGWVQAISKVGGSYQIVMQDGAVIALETVVAVNGVFAAQYGGC